MPCVIGHYTLYVSAINQINIEGKEKRSLYCICTFMTMSCIYAQVKITHYFVLFFKKREQVVKRLKDTVLLRLNDIGIVW